MIAYIVLVPLITAIAIPLFGLINKKTAYPVTLVCSFLSFFLVVKTSFKVFTYGGERYFFFFFEPPFGIEYVIDGLNSVILLIIAFMFLIITIYSGKSLQKEIEDKRVPLFYSLYTLFYTGIMGIVITGDIFNLYVFIEIASLSSYTLIAMGQKRNALMASYNYLILGTIGATFILIGIGYLFMATGSLNMADIKLRLVPQYHSKMVRTAFAFLTLGLMLKLAMFPLHVWLPNAYAYAPSAMGALLAATGTKVSAYALIRILYSVFTLEFDVKVIPFNTIFMVISVVAVLMGSILALSQKNLKKMLAYSSIGQIGYITLGISLSNSTSLQGSILHIFNHSLMKGGLFLIAGGIFYRLNIENISDLKGLSKKMPYTMVSFVILTLSMIGAPLTAGFLSKWYLILGAVESGHFFIVPVIIISSLLGLVYLWRVIEISYSNDEQKGTVSEMPSSMLVPVILVAALTVFFGVFSEIPLSLSKEAVRTIIGL